MKKVAIIGGGPAGIFCAIKLLEFNPAFEIDIFEKQEKPLLTILPTGNGRCNLAYDESNFRELASNFLRGEKFLYSIFSRYGKDDTVSDFERYGIETYVQDDKRIFPLSNKASEVRKGLLNQIRNMVKFYNVNVDEPLKGYDACVIATGLKFGADLIERYGHSVVPLKSSLVGLKIKEQEFCKLQGVSLNGVVFTSEGVSGPFIYKLSSINAYKDFPYEIKIPLLSVDELLSAVKNNPKKLFRNIVSNFIPKSLADVLVKSDVQCANASKKDILELEFLKLTAVSVDGKGEIVHAGGADLREIDKNLKSKICPNLWIIGEALDIDGFTGGFNLQNCWSTAAIAAQNIAETI